MSHRVAIGLVVTCIASGALLPRLEAADPWSDPSIEVDRDAELKLYREELDRRVGTFAIVHEKWTQGVAHAAEESHCRTHCFVMLARTKWIADDFESSYQAAMFARSASEKSVVAYEGLYFGGKVTLDNVQKAYDHRFEIRRVLLRYRAIAKERGIELPEVTPEMEEKKIMEMVARYRDSRNAK